MGSWGVKLYQDDVACDVKTEYVEALKKGISNEEITEKLINEYTGDIDDEPIFWFALADTQWNYGRLLQEVKSNAIKFIDSEVDLERWDENPKLYGKRKKVLEELKEKLNTPQPSEKKVRSYGKPYKCEWKIGDVFAYPLKSEEAKEAGFEGQYLILIKTGETKWYPEHIIPVVKIKITKNRKIPTAVEEINELEYIQSNVYLADFSVRKSAQKLPKDEYGFTPEYEFSIITTSNRVIPKSLQFIGNFNNQIKKPKIEYMVNMKDFAENVLDWKEIETKVINNYKFYNLRKGSIYAPNFWEERKKYLEECRLRGEKIMEEIKKSKNII